MKPLSEAKQDFMKDYLEKVMKKARGCTTKAAGIAGWSVPNFCALLRRYDMRASDFRSQL